MVSVTDAHVHVVSSDTDRYPLRPGQFGRDWWSGRAVDGPAITADLAAAGVDRAVIVQAVGPYRNDNRYAHDVVAESGGRFALVAAIDPEGPDPAAELVALGPVAGVRVSAFVDDAVWLTDGRGAAIWNAAAARGVNLVVACLAHHLERVGALARSRPDVTVALDHCAFPDVADPAPLLALAAVPSMHLKVTTIVLRDAGAGARAFIRRLVDAYGADRLSWGSDHPQTFEVPYPAMLALAIDAVAGLAADAQAAILDTTARRLWFGGR